VTPLDAALALAEVNGVAVHVGQNLELDMARAVQQLLQIHGAVAESGLGLAVRGGQRRVQLRLLADDAHPLAAAARRRLDHQREANAVRLVAQRPVVQAGLRPRHNRHTGPLHQLARSQLVAHPADGVRRRADPHQPRVNDRLGELGSLAEEAIAGVHRICTGAPGHVNQLADVQVALARAGRADVVRFVGVAHVQRFAVGVRVHGHRLDAA